MPAPILARLKAVPNPFDFQGRPRPLVRMVVERFSALQAVLMAIDMRAAIGELIEKWRKLGHDIGLGIGIAHGFATLGTIGFEGRFD